MLLASALLKTSKVQFRSFPSPKKTLNPKPLNPKP